jgi:ribosomal protein S5
MACLHLTVLGCTHAQASARYGRKPSKGVCSVCPDYDGPARGAGDVVHAVLERTGVANIVKKVTKGNCNCAERRAAMNAAVPFKEPVDSSR